MHIKFIALILFLNFYSNLFAQIQENKVVDNKGGLYHLSDAIYPQRYYAPKEELLLANKPYSNFEASQLLDINTTIRSYFSCNSIEWLKKISVKKEYPLNYEQATFNYRKEKTFAEQFKLYISSQFYLTYQKESYCISMVHAVYVYNTMRLFPVILVKKNNVWVVSDNADFLLFSAYLRIKPVHWVDLFRNEKTLPAPILKNIDYSGTRFLLSYDYYYSNIVFDNDSINKSTKIPLAKLHTNQSDVDITNFQQLFFQLIKKAGYSITLNSYEKGSNDIDQYFSTLTKPHSDTTAEQAMAYWLFSKDTVYQRKNCIGYHYMKKEFVNYMKVSGPSNRLSLKYNITLDLDGSNYKIIYFDEWHGIKNPNGPSCKEHWVGIKSIVLKKEGESWLVYLDKTGDVFKVLRGFDVLNEQGVNFCLTAKLSGNIKYDFLLDGRFMAPPDGRMYIENTIFLWPDYIYNYKIPEDLKNGFGVVAPYDLYEERNPKYWQDRTK